MKILIVEDEKKVSDFIKRGLKSEGYTVDTAFDGEEGLYLAEEEKYNVIILDIMLPKLDGVALCKKLREGKRDIPIIMLTAKDSVEDRIKGLDAGADDYLIKPFSFSELLARVRALSRRHGRIREAVQKIGDLSLNPETHEVKRSGKSINLSATEFNLLKFLMENKYRVVSKTLLLESVWGYDFSPESNLVEVYIKYLRDKIDKGFKKALITTVHGVGYRICG